MNEATIIHAAERIEAALSRIEKAAQQAADLRERHESLKGTLAQSLGDLDRLLAMAEASEDGASEDGA